MSDNIDKILNPTLFDVDKLDKSLGIKNTKNEEMAKLALITIDENGNIILDNKELKLHRDLSLYKIKQGKDGNIIVSKIKTAIFEFYQTNMRKHFSNKYSSLLESLLNIKNENLDILIENAYKNDFKLTKDYSKDLVINKKMINKFYSTVNDYNENYKKKYISGFTDEQI